MYQKYSLCFMLYYPITYSTKFKKGGGVNSWKISG